ncbi:MAG: hypothetical protein U0271_47645 [Polyangiaceae bacterium]
MTILLFDPEATAQSTLLSALRQLRLEVRRTSDASEARRLALGANPVVVVLNGQGSSAFEFIRDVRQIHSTYGYILVAHSDVPEERLLAAYSAGCDADVPLPISPAFLAARIAAAERVLTRLRTPRVQRATSDTTTPAASSGVQPAASGVRPAVHAQCASTAMVDLVVRAAAWRGMPLGLQEVLSSFLSTEVAARRLESAVDAAIVRGIRLANVGHELEVRIALVTDSASAQKLATHLFGSASPELEGDMIGEFANIAMGAMKSAFARESLAFTGGLPEVLSPHRLSEFISPCVRTEAFSLTALEARIDVRLGIVSKKNVLVSAHALAEGMVLAKDVFNARGMLLLTAGTRLSSTAAERLRQALVKTDSVEVAWRAS